MTVFVRRIFVFAALASMFVAAIACVSPDAPKRLSDLPEIGEAPEWEPGQWFNSAPLSMSGFRGKVVMIEFWTFG